MSARFSPPPFKPYRPEYRPKPHLISRKRLRWLWGLAAVVLFYLGFTSRLHILPKSHLVHMPSLNYKNVDWSHYAYSQFATDSAHLCNSVMVFEALSRLESKADRVLLYPQEWDTEISSDTDRDSQLLVKARDMYGVKLVPTDIIQTSESQGIFSKFSAWGQTEYERVLHLDSDVTILKHLDELFMLPRAPVAMMRAYWELPKIKKLAGSLILLEPSEAELGRLTAAASPGNRTKWDHDSDILDRLYGDSAMVLPHQQYGLLSGEFRSSNHTAFLGNSFEKFNADRSYREASLVHFSDSPLPKPWIMWPHNLIGDILPKCYSERGLEVKNCDEKKIWSNLYDDFRKRRKDVCALLSEMAPDWPPADGSGKPPDTLERPD